MDFVYAGWHADCFEWIALTIERTKSISNTERKYVHRPQHKTGNA